VHSIRENQGRLGVFGIRRAAAKLLDGLFLTEGAAQIPANGGCRALMMSLGYKGLCYSRASGAYGLDTRIDLSQVDFDALRSHFERVRKHIELRGCGSSQ